MKNASVNVDVLDSANYELGGKYSCHTADIVANFPACKMLMHEDDLTNLDSTWTDRVAGLVLTDSTSFTKDADGVNATNTNSISVTTGALPVVGAYDAVFIISGKFVNAATGVVLGDVGSTGPGIDVKAANGYIVEGAAYYEKPAPLPAITYPTDANAVISVHFDVADEEVRTFTISSDGAESGSSVKNAIGSSGSIPSLGAFDADAIVLPSGTNDRMSMFALFVFEAPITDNEAKAAITWMRSNRGKIYPYWARKA